MDLIKYCVIDNYFLLASHETEHDGVKKNKHLVFTYNYTTNRRNLYIMLYVM